MSKEQDSQIQRRLADLRSDDVTLYVKAAIMKDIAEWPTGNAEIRSVLCSFLSSRELVIYTIGAFHHYCELRYLAGEALIVERAFMGIEDNIMLEKTFVPATSSYFRDRAKSHQIDTSLCSLEKVISLLDEHSIMPRIDHEWHFRYGRWRLERKGISKPYNE